MKVLRYLYKQIKMWYEESRVDNHCPFDYPKLFRQMIRKYGLKCTHPRNNYIELDLDNVVKVTSFDFLAQVYSLLSDVALMREKNHVFGNDPFKKFKRKSHPANVQTSE